MNDVNNEELNEEKCINSQDELLKETIAVRIFAAYVIKLWALGGIIAGIIAFFKLNWTWALGIIFISFTIVTIFLVLSKTLQLLHFCYMVMVSTYRNTEELLEKMDSQDMFVEVIKKKRK